LRNKTISIRWLTGLVSPGGVLLFAAWALQREDLVRSAIAPYAIYFGFGALAAAALLSWYHNYAKVLCVAAAVGLAAWSSSGLSGDPSIPRILPAFLLPINFILFAWLAERAVLTPSGVMKLGVIGVQVVGVHFVSRSGSSGWGALLDVRPAAGWTWMPQSVLLSFFAAGLLLLFLAFRQQTKIAPALLWALAAAFAGLNHDKPDSLFFYTGAAGLILLLGVLEHGYDIAYLDELTGLPSRRAFNEALRLLHGQFSIAMCDADHFKVFNDTYGHDVGDQVLKMIASHLSDVGDSGRVFRFGGEEFAILFRKRTAMEVANIVESLRETVAGTEFVLSDMKRPTEKGAQEPNPADGKVVKITISIGLADRSQSRQTPEMVLKASDEALYRAKESGRNCVRLAQSTGSRETA